jgi:hypothetical protein
MTAIPRVGATGAQSFNKKIDVTDNSEIVARMKKDRESLERPSLGSRIKNLFS